MSIIEQIIRCVLEDDESFKDVFNSEPSATNFTDADVDERGYIWVERKQLIHAPLPWQKAGLQYTASGYGAKIPGEHLIIFNGKRYRIYHTCFGNSGSAWFVALGRKIHISGG